MAAGRTPLASTFLKGLISNVVAVVLSVTSGAIEVELILRSHVGSSYSALSGSSGSPKWVLSFRSLSFQFWACPVAWLSSAALISTRLRATWKEKHFFLLLVPFPRDAGVETRGQDCRDHRGKPMTGLSVGYALEASLGYSLGSLCPTASAC